MLKYSKHAQERSIQRAIYDEDLSFILALGKQYAVGDGSDGYFLGKRQAGQANIKCNLGAVIREDTVVTVMHMHAPPTHWVPLRD